MFKKILVNCGCEPDAKLLAHVLDFSRRAGGKLTAISVFEPPSSSALDYFKKRDRNLESIMLKDYQERLDAALKEAGAEEGEVESAVKWGTQFIEIIRTARYGEFDLIISSSSCDEPYPDPASMHLLRKGEMPIWIHQGKLWSGAVRIMAAVGSSDSGDGNEDLDRKILKTAAHLNEVLHGHLHVINCWSGYLESVAGNHRLISTRESQDYMEQVQAESEERFARLTASVDLPEKTKTVALHGDPGLVIPKYAEEKRMDVVVMGSVARTGIPGLLIGNTAEKIVGSLTCSILTVKPEGFESPVK